MTVIHLQCRPRPTSSVVPGPVVEPEAPADVDLTTDPAAEVTAAQLMWQAADLVTPESSKTDKFCALRLYGYCFPDHSDAYTEEQINRAWRLHEEIISYGNRPTEPRINQLLAQISDIGFGRDQTI